MSGYTVKRAVFEYHARNHKISLGSETKIMGILNVTPDSFSDGGLFLDPGAAEEQALRMEREGAHVIDIGGESSKPGTRPISAKEEIERIKPVIRRLAKKIKIPLSIDTCKYETAQAALDEGASIINDIYALRNNKPLAKLIAKYKAGIVLMHMQGTPETMQKGPSYKNLFKEIRTYLKEATKRALEAGIPKANIMIDPGFGFGKKIEHNIELLGLLSEFSKLKYPLLVGFSRKSFIGQLAGAEVQDRLYGSLAASACALYQGAHVLRAHDVLPHVQFCKVIDKTLKR